MLFWLAISYAHLGLSDELDIPIVEDDFSSPVLCEMPRAPVRSVLNRDVSTIDIQADSTQAWLLDKRAVLDGDVLLQQGEQTLSADRVFYHYVKETVEAEGNVLFTRGDAQLHAEQMHYDLQHQSGQAWRTNYQLADIPARGQASRVELVKPDLSRYEQMTYTSCPPGNDDWRLSAAELTIDRAEGFGVAQHATLSFMGAPIAYLPWMTFPVDNRRRSGFLIPRIRYSGKDGLDLTVPYYLNIAPNYDVTLMPRIMSERGLMLGGELRFLTESTSGVLQVEYLPEDRLNPVYTEGRSSFLLDAQSRFSPNLSGDIQFEHVSDDDYLNDLGNQLSISTESLLQRRAELRYQAEDWHVAARLKNYQVLNDGSEPYDILPQLRLSLQKPSEQSGLIYHLDSEVIHFTKHNDAVEGTRWHIHPAMSLPTEADYYHLRPKIGTYYTQYALSNRTDGLSRSPSRLAAMFSLDGGLYFERDTTYFGVEARQTLEPRFYYLYTTRSDQDDIPVFDTGRYGFSTAALFRENRFNSVDRLGDANQVSLNLTTRYSDSQTGADEFKADIGQIFYFQDREVTLPGGGVEQRESSAVTANVTAYPGENWRVTGDLLWDPDQEETTQLLTQLHYRKDHAHLFNLTHRVRDDTAGHMDLSGIWPVSKKTRIMSYLRHSLEDERNEEAILGVEYGSCCWRVRTLLHQYMEAREDYDLERVAFFIQLELKGLGTLGDDFEELLSSSIYGYRREN